MKIKAKATARTEQKGLALMPFMYGNPKRWREQLELERLRLELERMKVEIAATQAETEAKSSMALTANAKSGVAAMEKNRDQITKLAKKGLGSTKEGLASATECPDVAPVAPGLATS